MDRATFEALFRDHYGRLCGYAQTIVRTRADAEDVVQEVFVNLWRTRDSLVIRASGRAYLYRAVRNGALNRVRGDRTIASLSESPARMPVADPGEDPSTAILSREAVNELRAAMATLGPRCRQVLRLRWIDGLSHEEIAETLGITRKAVESNITRGLRALRELLGDDTA